MLDFAKSWIAHNSDFLGRLLLGAAGILAVRCLASPPQSLGQTTAAARPEFEVASVRPVDPASRETTNMRRLPGGRSNGDERHPEVPDYRGVWRSRHRYLWRDSLPLMLQSLLEERFKLAIRRESRELPVYALLLTETGGKYGPNLREADWGLSGRAAANASPNQIGALDSVRWLS
jgi:hypothetical protein